MPEVTTRSILFGFAMMWLLSLAGLIDAPCPSP
jgi:hypothetical protein